MEIPEKIMEKLNELGITSKMISNDEEWEKYKASVYNRTVGHLNERDGYDCKICLNKGDIWRVKQNSGGVWTHISADCKCLKTRECILKMQRSGLKNVIANYTFERYEATDAWQQSIKDKAQAYAAAPEGWFFIGGQSGAGKTHICTAISRKFLLDGMEVVYMQWRDDIAKIKSLAMDSEPRAEMVERFKKVRVLYIDDLFKTGKNRDGIVGRPTEADVTTAFEIINYRYNNPDMLTIISSEWTQDDLLDIDEAVGGRIFERAGANGISIAKDRSRNYRTRKAVTI